MLTDWPQSDASENVSIHEQQPDLFASLSLDKEISAQIGKRWLSPFARLSQSEVNRVSLCLRESDRVVPVDCLPLDVGLIASDVHDCFWCDESF
jgi:hypothetical protein